MTKKRHGCWKWLGGGIISFSLKKSRQMAHVNLGSLQPKKALNGELAAKTVIPPAPSLGLRRLDSCSDTNDDRLINH